jgi:hypothetical protein
VFLGEVDKALDYADKIERIVGDKEIKGDYWKTATVAEVMLIKKNYSAASNMYQKAIDIFRRMILAA